MVSLSTHSVMHRALAGEGEEVAFSPSDISWILSLDAELGISLNGSDVSSWADQGGEGNDIIQATPGNQPAYISSDSDFNDLPSVDCDSGEWLRTNGIWTGGSISQPNTFIWVSNMVTLIGGRYLYDGHTSGRNAVYDIAGPGLQAFAGSGGPTQSTVLGTTYIGIVEYNGSSTNFYLNGGTPSTANAGALGSDGLTLGARSTTGQNEMRSKTAEFYVYDGLLSTENKNNMRTYLGAKYDLTTTEIS